MRSPRLGRDRTWASEKSKQISRALHPPHPFRSPELRPEEARGTPELAERKAKKSSFQSQWGDRSSDAAPLSARAHPRNSEWAAPRAGRRYTTSSRWGVKNSTCRCSGTAGAKPRARAAPARHTDTPSSWVRNAFLKLYPNLSSLDFHAHKCGQHFSISLIPCELLPILHKALNRICRRPRNRTIRRHTYLGLTSRLFTRPHRRASQRISLSASQKVRSQRAPRRLLGACSGSPDALTRSALGDYNSQNPLGGRPQRHPEATSPAFLPPTLFLSPSVTSRFGLS